MGQDVDPGNLEHQSCPCAGRCHRGDAASFMTQGQDAKTLMSSMPPLGKAGGFSCLHNAKQWVTLKFFGYDLTDSEFYGACLPFVWMQG